MTLLTAENIGRIATAGLPEPERLPLPAELEALAVALLRYDAAYGAAYRALGQRVGEYRRAAQDFPRTFNELVALNEYETIAAAALVAFKTATDTTPGKAGKALRAYRWYGGETTMYGTREQAIRLLREAGSNGLSE